MEEEWTCGKGLAAHSALPLAIGEMLSAMAEMLNAHTKALELTDPQARTEYSAYASLVAQHDMVARSLFSIGAEMAAYAELPMAAHDMEVMASPEFGAAFQALAKTEHDLLQILTETVSEHEAMLSQ